MIYSVFPPIMDGNLPAQLQEMNDSMEIHIINIMEDLCNGQDNTYIGEDGKEYFKNNTDDTKWLNNVLVNSFLDGYDFDLDTDQSGNVIGNINKRLEKRGYEIQGGVWHDYERWSGTISKKGDHRYFLFGDRENAPTIGACCVSLGNDEFFDIPDGTASIVIPPFATKSAACPSKIKIPGSMKKILFKAFANAANLTDVTFAERTMFRTLSIQNYAFSNSGVTNIELPDGITSNRPNVSAIAKGMFEDCKFLKTVRIPKSVEIIEQSAFQGCQNLSDIQFYNGISYLKIIDRKAFRGCSSLETLDLTSAFMLRSILYNAFAGCTSLKSVMLPPRLKVIDGHVFDGCESLEEVTVLGRETSFVDESVFNGCDRSKLCIHCYNFSYAQMWCHDHHITYHIIGNIKEGNHGQI